MPDSSSRGPEVAWEALLLGRGGDASDRGAAETKCGGGWADSEQCLHRCRPHRGKRHLTELIPERPSHDNRPRGHPSSPPSLTGRAEGE